MAESKMSELADIYFDGRNLMRSGRAIGNTYHRDDGEIIGKMAAELRRLESVESELVSERKLNELNKNAIRLYDEQRVRIEEVKAALESRVLHLRGMTHTKPTTDYQCAICWQAAASKGTICHKPDCVLAKEPTDD